MPCPEFNHQELRERRSQYAYPAIALQGDLRNYQAIGFDSTFALDGYLKRLLHDDNAENRVFGYLAVLFWGHYSGQDGIVRSQRAFGKVRLAFEGQDRVVGGQPQRMRGVTDISVDMAAEYINLAIIELAQDNYAGALTQLAELPGIQIAFASKICAFIDPAKCGVIDSVIAERHPEFGFALRDGYVINNIENRNRYVNYCMCLQEIAGQLNNDEQNSQWIDRDGVERPWRAIDVERALY